ncbi:hypothetical protein CEV32_3977 [Brucella rhizosphaerae]|uniref:Uncharacterized protein n=1 Tax=Brucella rhizosphaerae TaxID=571254 RepID=A0A256FQP6_9HYPH|nr:hypothetical protein CEV32_3977 [Brucella rhizosphaerae]
MLFPKTPGPFNTIWSRSFRFERRKYNCLEFRFQPVCGATI